MLLALYTTNKHVHDSDLGHQHKNANEAFKKWYFDRSRQQFRYFTGAWINVILDLDVLKRNKRRFNKIYLIRRSWNFQRF